MAERLSRLADAPRNLVGQLARENEIAIAGPLLRRSPVIDEDTLIEIAAAKGQGYLLASGRRCRPISLMLSFAAATAMWSGARPATQARGSGRPAMRCWSPANSDGVLTLAVGQRADLSAPQLKELLARSIDVIPHRLLDVVKPERQSAIRGMVSEISGAPAKVESRRNFVPAQHAILALHNAGGLNEAALLNFAKSFKYEESIAALSAMSAVKIATLDRLISGERRDPILIIGKTIGLEWATVRALILLRPVRIVLRRPPTSRPVRVNFTRLMRSTAVRVVGFWRARQSA